MTRRERATQIAETYRGVHEIGTSNWGAMVQVFLASTGITFPAAWCQAFVHYCFLQAGASLGGGASAFGFEAWAAKVGEEVQRPRRGDIAVFPIGKGHAGIVRKVIGLGPVCIIRTVEGNTSGNAAGPQDDGGSVEFKTRQIKGTRFFRVQATLPLNDPYTLWAAWRRSGAKPGKRPKGLPEKVPDWYWKLLKAGK